jgi:hypothetical protein
MVEAWKNRQDDCIVEVRGAMIDFKERWEKDSVDGADAKDNGIDEVDGKNAASDAKRRVKSEDGEQQTRGHTKRLAKGGSMV